MQKHGDKSPSEHKSLEKVKVSNSMQNFFWREKGNSGGGPRVVRERNERGKQRIRRGKVELDS